MPFNEVGTWPRHEIAVDVAALGGDRTAVAVCRIRRPLSVGQLAELLCQYEWSRQLDVLSYMKRFPTWDQLYDDLDRRERESVSPHVRNVTPARPKLIEEKHE